MPPFFYASIDQLLNGNIYRTGRLCHSGLRFEQKQKMLELNDRI